ncbi:MAG: hypothetical protein GY711_35810 [bacterium]|nr:hypothetical protein [bacterium]
MRALALLATACATTAAAHAQTCIIGGYAGDALSEVVIATGAINNTTAVSDSLFAMAVHPISGVVYCITTGGRDLGTIDVSTGTVTHIGSMGDAHNALAFESDGTLWATTGEGASTEGSLWTVDATTGATTFVTALDQAANEDGEVLAYNPDDGLLYRASGNDPFIFQSIDPSNPLAPAVTIPLSSPTSAEWLGMTYMGGGTFLYSDRNDELNIVDTFGNVTFASDPGLYQRGLIIPEDQLGTNVCGPAIANSTGGPATMSAVGTLNADVTLRATGLPTNQSSYFLASDAFRAVPFMPPGSAGNFCLGGGNNLGRYDGLVHDSGDIGAITIEIDHSVVPIAGGSDPNGPFTTDVTGLTWYFSCWYRDGATDNFADVLCIQFQP